MYKDSRKYGDSRLSGLYSCPTIILPNILSCTCSVLSFCKPPGRLAYKHYEAMRKEVASIKIQKDLRRNLSRKAYKQLNSSALVLQTFARKIAACNQFKHKKQASPSEFLKLSTTSVATGLVPPKSECREEPLECKSLPNSLLSPPNRRRRNRDSLLQTSF